MVNWLEYNNIIIFWLLSCEMKKVKMKRIKYRFTTFDIYLDIIVHSKMWSHLFILCIFVFKYIRKIISGFFISKNELCFIDVRSRCTWGTWDDRSFFANHLYFYQDILLHSCIIDWAVTMKTYGPPMKIRCRNKIHS